MDMMRIMYRLAACVAVALVVISTIMMKNGTTVNDLTRQVHEALQSTRQRESVHATIFNIVWLRPKYEIRQWLTLEEKLFRGFGLCEYRNCNITYSTTASMAVTADAIIFPGREVGPKTSFKRPLGQVWIFHELESPEMMGDTGNKWWRDPWTNQFNWTMTYDTQHTDISFKYGGIRLKSARPDRNYTAIALNKTGDVLIVNSHCKTPSKRETYIAELGKHILVKVFGGCGDKWTCGRRYVHDNCFEILNQYRYYLAFENSLCDMYFTEKLFNNFDYDTVIITRGGGRGGKGDIQRVLPEGTYISTDEFDSAKSLAEHLNNLTSSVTDYAAMLKRKDRYHNVGYATMYKEAMCDVCKRMNRQDEYRKTIPDIRDHWFSKKPCRKPGDLG